MDCFIGEIRILPYRYAPEEWAWCNGQSMPTQQFQALYSIIGTTYGGDGRTSFKLPNMSPGTQRPGSAPLGTGQGPNLSLRTLGDKTIGTPSVTLTLDQIPPHTHGFITHNYLHSSDALSDPKGNWLTRGVARDAGADVIFDTYVGFQSGSTQLLGASAIGTVGEGQSHENRQPYLAMNFCIALNGEYPQRY